MKPLQQNSGAQLYLKAKTLIPGGTQLLSKRPERFLPDLWPAYYKRAKGCEVWDLDGNHYYDFAQMGVGSCILGYADEEVNAAVIESVQNGNMCTLNSYEEVALAERLVGLHPWAEKVRFGRTGGEACAIAVRIGRAASGKSLVAFCGYHGWHDWYLSANLADAKNLDGQLLPGLAPSGVPRHLRGSVVPFQFNDLSSLERVASEHGDEIGVIIMEPERGSKPTPEFLAGVRDVADRLKAVLIFDEVTSGFRLNDGGIHLTLGVNPDIAVFGKALGNGYPIAAIIGRGAVMDAAQDSFISSTFWTERVGFTAALATLEKVARCQVPAQLCRYGDQLIGGLAAAATRHSIPLAISGIPPLIYLTFKHPLSAEIQTFWSQEMLKKGYLLGGAIYTSLAYSEELNARFLADSDTVFAALRTHLETGKLPARLEARVIQSGFRRLT